MNAADNMPHPVQPLYIDEGNTERFKQNGIVRFLLDNGPHDMNKLATMYFSQDDRQQFAQLIGYSLAGYGELSYVDDAAFERASARSVAIVDTAPASVAPALANRLAELFADKLSARLVDHVAPVLESIANRAVIEGGVMKVDAAIGESLAVVERRMILATLDHFKGSKERTAATLGVSLKTLYNRLKEYEADASVGETVEGGS